jgi:hypothetical protein
MATLSAKKWWEYVRPLMGKDTSTPDGLAICTSCGERFNALICKYSGTKCPECYLELHYGIIIPQFMEKYDCGGGREVIHHPITDETSPSFENAERLLEDNG